MARLTIMQRRILGAMVEDSLGFAAFTGERSRVDGFGILPAKHGGIIVRAYGTPEIFLRQRGLIEPCERNVPGRWYRMTTTGYSAGLHAYDGR
jgi:hypothetical protein